MNEKLKNGFILMSLCVCTGIMFSACSKTGVAPETVTVAIVRYQKITATEAKEMMDSGRPFVLLDVRTEPEYLARRIDGSLLIPDYAIRERAAAELPDKSALILIYCRSGRRSASAANELIRMGYTDVYDFGGIIEWPFDTVSGSN